MYKQQSIFQNPLDFRGASAPESQLSDIYANMERLKQLQQLTQPQIPQRTVFSDIMDELKDMSEDEKRFIETSEEYQKANLAYQESFTNFLLEKLGPEYLSSTYGKAPEQVLLVIKQKKEKYKSQFAADITSIKEQNNSLAERNENLIRTNIELQKQLKEIQERLLMEKSK
jgi:ABC-type transporter Mla subunit MlaD